MDECESSHDRIMQHALECTHPLQEELMCYSALPKVTYFVVPMNVTSKLLVFTAFYFVTFMLSATAVSNTILDSFLQYHFT
jgi:hypothetical protein